jgi:hypothetical protein
MPQIRREEFIWEFTRIGKIPTIYKKLSSNNKSYTNKENADVPNTSNVICATLLPNFLTPFIKNEELYTLEKITHKNFSGAGISITYPETFDGFLNKNLKTQIRKNLRRTISRLEESFNITYKYYFGEITTEEFNFLLNTLKNFLVKRFDQKNMLNHFLNEWNKNIEGLFELINQKKASFIVVYDNEKPISISLNRHIENSIMHSDCNGYDLDYSKYGLGHLDNYLLLKWCFENEYDFLDLGIGVIEYKTKWCNTYYDFEYHIYYKKKSLTAKIVASVEINKIKAKNLVKELKLDVYLKKLKATLTKKDMPMDTDNVTYNLEEITSSDTYNSQDLTKLNIYLPETEGIRQPIYDYLYSNNGHIDNIELFKVENEPNTYIFKTETKINKVIFNK